MWMGGVRRTQVGAKPNIGLFACIRESYAAIRAVQQYAICPSFLPPASCPRPAERALCNRCATCLENLHFHCAGCDQDICPICAR